MIGFCSVYIFGWDSDTFAFVARRAFLKVVLLWKWHCLDDGLHYGVMDVIDFLVSCPCYNLFLRIVKFAILNIAARSRMVGSGVIDDPRIVDPMYDRLVVTGQNKSTILPVRVPKQKRMKNCEPFLPIDVLLLMSTSYMRGKR